MIKAFLVKYKMYLLGVLVIVAFGAGWTLNGWKQDSIELAAQKAAEKTQVLTAKAISEIEVRNVTIRQIRTSRVQAVVAGNAL